VRASELYELKNGAPIVVGSRIYLCEVIGDAAKLSWSRRDFGERLLGDDTEGRQVYRELFWVERSQFLQRCVAASYIQYTFALFWVLQGTLLDSRELAKYLAQQRAGGSEVASFSAALNFPPRLGHLFF
jgi:hypothetical protein